MARSTGKFIDAIENPEAANAAIARALAPDMDAPVIEAAVDDEVTLPGGLVLGGRVVKSAQVRELDGNAEEAMGRAAASPHPERLMNTLLGAGVADIGGYPVNEEVLDRLLVGDRDYLVLGIRKQTYGSKIEYERWVCPTCSGEFSMSVDIDEIPVVRVEVAEEYTVALRGGKSARIRLTTGGDEAALMRANREGTANPAEQDTLLLSRTVIAINDGGGERIVAGDKNAVRALGMGDRSKLLKALRDNRPGPRMDEVPIVCPDCGVKTKITITIDALFQR